ncbi:phage NrS-1 polymerase family protein [Thermus caldilimi]|uniref:phage NrS-1 polymerase family protein n=1 Tax=Thermus caldilimi TaxID=2483360 RepID=UPI00198000A7|nr:hypothetical protein [Thermus caldilimi]
MSVDWAALGKRFVVWRYEERGGKRTKVPYNGKGRASVRNPEGWLTYEEALVLAKRFDGVGVVLGGDLHGVDLDWKGREGVPEEVVEIIEALGSYTEWSPSGEGVHILFRGQFAPVASRGLLPSGVGVEIYVYSSPGGRFFTLTERCWEGKCVLREASEERLRSLAARVLPEAFVRYLEAHPEVKALWRGEWEERYPSQSEADLALASHLLRFTRGDKGEADRLFRLSGLYRPKWDEDRGGRTYGEMTLDRAGGRSSSSPSRSEGGSKLDAALSLLRSRVSLWRTEDREVFADLPGGRSYRVRDGRFRAWALGQMRAEGVLLRGSEWSDLVLHLEADGDQAPEFPLFVRVAGYGGTFTWTWGKVCLWCAFTLEGGIPFLLRRLPFVLSVPLMLDLCLSLTRTGIPCSSGVF